jgi:hypothetical protein
MERAKRRVIGADEWSGAGSRPLVRSSLGSSAATKQRVMNVATEEALAPMRGAEPVQPLQPSPLHSPRRVLPISLFIYIIFYFIFIILYYLLFILLLLLIILLLI